MLLTENQVKLIINKPKIVLKNNLYYNYSLEEQLNLIQTYIKEKKGNDIGDIKPPKGEMCPSFIKKSIQHGVNPMVAMSNGSDLVAANFAMDVSLKHFKNKYNENL